MRRKVFMGIVVAVMLGVGGYIAYRVISSRPLSPSQTITYNYNGLDLKVVYCRPYKKKRVIFGNEAQGALVPNGKYWRLGANNATEITLSKDVTIAGKSLKAGSYRLYAVPGESSWEISFNSELGKWGYDEPDHSKDVLKVQAAVTKAGAATEQFTISFSNSSTGVNMNLDWDQTHLVVPIAVQ